MPWIEGRRRKDGTVGYWIRDIRDGRQVCIAAGNKPEAEMRLEQYRIRKALEKERYNDPYREEIV